MINKLPMTLLAQIDDVVVFQTAAFLTDVVNDSESKNQKIGQQNPANYGDLNLGLHVNDDAAKVLKNRMCLLSGINERFLASESKRFQYVPIKRLHWVSQVHGNNVHDVDATVLSMTPMAADAMVSQQQGNI